MKKFLFTFFALVWLSGMVNRVQAADSSQVSYRELSSKTCEVTSVRYDFSGPITIPEQYRGYTVVGIADNAFKGAYAITSVKLPETITYIGSNAFEGTRLLKEINMPSSLETLGSYAFHNSGLESIELPENLKSGGQDVFLGCENLKTVYYNSIDAKFYWSIYHMVFPTTVEKVEFGPKVELITKGAFLECDKITEVKLPESLKTIYPKAFSGCTGLTSLKMGGNVIEIGDDAFNGCVNVKEWELSPSLVTIGKDAFANCVGLKKVIFSENFNSIGSGAFKGCSEIEEIYCNTDVVLRDIGLDDPVFDKEIPLKKIEYGLKGFGCYRLLKDIINVDEVMYNTIDMQVPSNYSNYENYIVPHTAKKVTIGEGVVKIPDYFMPGNSYVQEIMLPQSLQSIGKNAFQSSALTKIEFPDECLYINDYAFADCKSLSQVGWNNILFIGDYSFRGCPIKELDDINNIIGLGKGAFQDNEALESVTLINRLLLPDKLFSGCTNLKSLYYDSDYLMYEDKNIQFLNCISGSLENVTLGPQVRYVASNMFADLTKLKSVTLGPSTYQICNDAFNGCVSLEKVEIPSGVRYLGKRVFKGCSALPEIILPADITEIPEECFADCNALSRVVLPDNLTSIRKSAFSHCGITEIKFGNCPVEIESDAFFSNVYENQVEKLEFGNLDAFIYSQYENDKAAPVSWDILADLFVDGKEVKEVVLPEDITEICPGKFMSLINVDVKVPKHVTSVGERAFRNSGIKYFESDALKSVSTEGFAFSKLIEFRATGSMDHIYYGTFWCMDELEVLILPDNIRHIDTYGVAQLPKLKKVRMPADLVSVSEQFRTRIGDSLMEEVYYPAEKPQEIPSLGFGNIYSATLYVPSGALESAKRLDPWKYFGNIVAYDFAEESAVETVSAEKSEEEIITIYNSAGVDMGRSLENLPKGIYFVKKANSTDKIIKF